VSETGSNGTGSVKDEIRRVSLDLLVRHGYQGFRFRDVAEALGTTRANIHHHYGSKQNLCDEVVVAYVDLILARWEANWRGEASFLDKIEGMIEVNRQRYRHYNPTGETAEPWSIITRMRLDGDVIGPQARAALARFTTSLQAVVLAGVDQAVMRGELAPDLPREDIALQLVAIADGAGVVTQGGSFGRLERLYRSFGRIVHDAYGLHAAAGAPAPPQHRQA
jgi:AcrR family transcriptional regulator